MAKVLQFSEITPGLAFTEFDFYKDYEEAKTMGFTNDDLQHIMEQNILELNQVHPAYSKISQIKLMEDEFEKTPKKSITRYLYKDVEI